MAKKLNVSFNKEQTEVLERMAKDLETTKTSVLKTALALLEIAIRENRKGNTLSVIKDDKVIKEIVGIF